MAKTKIFFITTFFILAVFLNVEKAGADSCENGSGTCSNDFCKTGEKTIAFHKDCDINQRCCIPITACQNTGDMCGVSYNNTSCCNGLTCTQGSGGIFTCQTGIIGGTCQGSCQAASCGANQNEIQGPFTNCSGSMYCCVPNNSGTPPPPNPPPPGSPPPPNPPPSPLTGSGVVIPENTGLADPPGGIAQILENLLFWLLAIIGIIALIGFVISGIQYVISTGDEDMMKTAKRNMLYCIVGIAVALAGVVIVNAINAILQADPWI